MKKTKFLALLMSATLALGVMPAYAQTSEQTAEGGQLVLEQEVVIEKESSNMSYTFENGIFSMVDGEYSITLSNVTAVKERELTFYHHLDEEPYEALGHYVVVYCSDDTKILDKSFELVYADWCESYVSANTHKTGSIHYFIEEDSDRLSFDETAVHTLWSDAIEWDAELDAYGKLSEKFGGEYTWIEGNPTICMGFANNILLTSEDMSTQNSTNYSLSIIKFLSPNSEGVKYPKEP